MASWLLILASTAVSTALTVADVQTDGKRQLRGLVESIPRYLQECDFSPLLPKDQQTISSPHSRVMKAEMTRKNQATVIIGEYGANSMSPNGIITIRLKYFGGKWHVRQHEESEYYRQGNPRDNLLKILALIDSHK